MENKINEKTNDELLAEFDNSVNNVLNQLKGTSFSYAKRVLKSAIIQLEVEKDEILYV